MTIIVNAGGRTWAVDEANLMRFLQQNASEVASGIHQTSHEGWRMPAPAQAPSNIRPGEVLLRE